MAQVIQGHFHYHGQRLLAEWQRLRRIPKLIPAAQPRGPAEPKIIRLADLIEEQRRGER